MSAIRTGDNEITRRSIQRNQEEIKRESYTKRILRALISGVSIGRTCVLGISFSFIDICTITTILHAINGIFDVIGYFFVGGMICTIFYIPFAKEICSKTKTILQRLYQTKRNKSNII